MASRLRREPPRFRRVAVRRTEPVTPRLVRVTLAGPELEGFEPPDLAASVRLLLPSEPGAGLVMPDWNGNEFLLPDGRRPVIRTLTPVRFDAAASELDVEIVRHGGGAASTWADRATADPGAEAAVSGPGRGYALDPDAGAYFLAGDETALPAVRQLLDALPPGASVEAHMEIAHPDARMDLPHVSWHELPADAAPGAALVDAVRDAQLAEGMRVWVAGEAAAVQRVRKHLFEELGMPRSQATVRGYWKRGRTADADSPADSQEP